MYGRVLINTVSLIKNIIYRLPDVIENNDPCSKLLNSKECPYNLYKFDAVAIISIIE